METPGQTLTLYPKKERFIFLFFMSLLFCIGGYWMVHNGNSFGWVAIAFFGIGLVIFPLSLLPNSTYLKLTAEGFELKTPIKSHFTKWSDVDTFFVGYIGSNKSVVFNYSASYTRQATGRELSKALTGAEGAIGNNYDRSSDELAALMNEWKMRHDLQVAAKKTSGFW